MLQTGLKRLRLTPYAPFKKGLTQRSRLKK